MVNEIMNHPDFIGEPDFNSHLEPSSDDDSPALDNQDEDQIDVVNNNEVAELLQDVISRVEEQQPVPSTSADLSMPQDLRQNPPSAVLGEVFLRPSHTYNQHPNPSRVSVGAAQPSATPAGTNQPVRPDTTQRSTQTRDPSGCSHPNTAGESAFTPPRPRMTAYVSAQAGTSADQVPGSNPEPAEALRQCADALRRSTEQLRNSLRGVPGQSAQNVGRSAQTVNRAAQPTGRVARPLPRCCRPNCHSCMAMRRETSALRLRQDVAIAAAAAAAAAATAASGVCPGCVAEGRDVPTVEIPPYRGGTIVIGQPLLEGDSIIIVAHVPNPPVQQPQKPAPPPKVASNTCPSTSCPSDHYDSTSFANRRPSTHGRRVCYWCTFNTNDDRAIVKHLMKKHPARFFPPAYMS